MSDERPPMDPGALMRLATSYWESRCLLTANDLGVFEALAAGPRRSEDLAAELGFDPRALRLFLNACVGLDLLEQEEAGFRNAPVPAAFLVRGSPIYLGDAIRYGSDMWEAWTHLPDALRSGIPPLAPESYTGDDVERTRHFVRGMHNRALGIGSALVSIVDLGGRRRLLDVGGGPGTYSALFARANPELSAVVIDLPEVARLAREILDTLEGGERVETLPGDYHQTAFPTGHDVVLMSGIFHRESEKACETLIERARNALDPGGLLVVSDVFTETDEANPSFASLFGVNMMLSAPEGGVHSDTKVAGWMETAGFRDVERVAFPPPMPHRVVLGVR